MGTSNNIVALRCKATKIKETTIQGTFIIDLLEVPLYESDDFSGNIIECNEGDLLWINIDKVMDLNLWESDRIFLKELINTNNTIKIEFHYDGDKLVSYKNI